MKVSYKITTIDKIQVNQIILEINLKIRIKNYPMVESQKKIILQMNNNKKIFFMKQVASKKVIVKKKLKIIFKKT